MELYTTQAERLIILEIEGKFDGYAAPQLAEWLKQTVNGDNARILIDLAKVVFLDSIALATLVQGMKRCRELRGDLYLCNLQAPVKVIFELTRLDKAFQIFPDRPTALSNLHAD